MRFADEDFPAAPYPGCRPATSYVHDDATGWALTPDPTGWRVAGTGLDTWLTERGAAPTADRVPVLCYGSNACPSKLTWLRTALGLQGPAVVLLARCTGLAAVWASGLRIVDDQRPATLAAMAGNSEDHVVWLAAPDQVAVLDRCEGRGERYHLTHVDTGEVRLEDGTVVDGPLAYTAAAPRRMPLLMDGRPVRCLDVPQSRATALTGVAADTHGLAVRVVTGAPAPAEFPSRVFVYGTLQPHAEAWRRLERHATGAHEARMPGALYDTGRGYPALRLGDGPGVAGWVVELANPATALAELDEYEGGEYRRIRVALPGGLQCWTYKWVNSVDGLRMLTARWADADPSRR
ncbi:gamma-glutamylcyclotransferase [Actinophytocola sp.]|uniref:gamma-glutamylcyclotransferase n=1 Tax=Actinophytocola sp. TaxID=1872138 RepID=UPI002ED5EA9A